MVILRFGLILGVVGVLCFEEFIIFYLREFGSLIFSSFSIFVGKTES